MLAPSVPVLDKWKERLVVVCEVLGKAVVPERKAFRRLVVRRPSLLLGMPSSSLSERVGGTSCRIVIALSWGRLAQRL